ncbi:MAG: transcription termination/antitermination NusG family protein [Planctomycetota bacterium]
MPVLHEEISLYPEWLLDEQDQDAAGRQWWVLYTKARQEKSLARDLVGYEVPFYLPLVRKNSAHRGRKITSHLPLFPGYVFLCGSEQDRVQALTTNRISRVLNVSDSEGLRRDLCQIHRLITADEPLTVEARLSAGSRVRVRFGPLAGVEGSVLSRRGATRLVVSVDFLQQGASVEIDDFMLEPID